MTRARTIFFFSALLLLLMPPGNCQSATGEAAFFTARPWLADASPLEQDIDLSKGKVGRGTLGCFGIGNGGTFALIGLDFPQNRLFNIIGPNYETSESFFGPVWNFLEKDGQPVALPASRLYRVRGTDIIVSRESGGPVELTTVTFAPRQPNAIFRFVTVKNISDAPLHGYNLITAAGEKQEKSKYSDEFLVQDKNDRRMLVNLQYAAAGARDGELASEVRNLGPGEEMSFILRISFTSTADESWRTAKPETPDPGELLDGARDFWRDWLRGSLSVTSSDSRLDGLFEGMLVLLKSQEPAGTGAVAVMARYSGAWCRDAFGPLRFYLLAGKIDEAKNIAEFYDLATRVSGFRNRYPADIDISKAPDSFDWNSIEPQQGDDPNILILLNYYYWRATGDKAFIRDRYGFMRRNMTGQHIDKYRFPFHGDETYQVYVMMQDGAPMKDFYSADTSFYYTAAARAMSEMAAALGKRSDAKDFAARAKECAKYAENYYWSGERGSYIPYVKKENLQPAAAPFANINLSPLWMGYGDPADPHQRSNTINTAKKLMTKSGTMKTGTRVSNYTGMAPGMLLYNLKAIGLMTRADAAYEGLMSRAMSTTGEFAENYDSNDRWVDYTTYANVYRPWESAINAEAVLYYLTGVKYDPKKNRVTLQPQLPPNVKNFRLDNLYAGPHAISIETTLKSDEHLTYLDIRITNNSDKPFELELLTETICCIGPPEGAKPFESAAYGRTLYRQLKKLAPGETFQTSGALPEEE